MKKFWLIYFLVIIFFGILTGILFLGNPFSTDAKQTINSPLPDFLTRLKNSQVSTLNFWVPRKETIGSSIKEPQNLATSVLVYELNSDKILYSKNADQKVPMASLTKIMTAVVALENPRPDDKYIVREQILVGENSMYLTAGEILSLEELLYGLILVSANDAAEVLADNYKNGRVEFIKAMNNKVEALGIKDTNFTNPSGLQGDGDQFTTAYDLLVITKYALSNFELFRKVASTFEYTVSDTAYHKARYLQNETNLLTTYPGVKGVKTGYTPEAGLCLVTYLEHNNHKIIGILLGSNNRRQEMKELLDYSLKSLGETPPPHQ